MTCRVFVDLPIHPEGLRRLAALQDVQVILADPVVEDRPIVRESEQIAPCEVMLCSYPPENLADMTRLKLIQIASSGFSQLEGLDLPGKGIRTCNARGVFDTAIAEWNVAMMICLARNMRQMIRNQEGAVWDRASMFQNEIRGKTVGFWGYGGFARQTARLCKALGMTVFALTRSGVKPRINIYCVPESGDVEGVFPDRIFTLDGKQQFLEALDFLILCTPQTAETEGMVGPDEMRALPQTAVLLNPARGPLVQEAALLQALHEGWIAGAALDTHYQYPLPTNHPLWGFENVILTPHISGSSSGLYFLSRVWDLFVQNMERYSTKRALLNELTPTHLTSS